MVGSIVSVRAQKPDLPNRSCPLRWSLSVFLLIACADNPSGSPCDKTEWFEDADGDGVGSADRTVSACEQPEGFVAESGDCDDDNHTAFPGNGEVCNGIDNDCDGTPDNGVATFAVYPDADKDGAGDASSPEQACRTPEGYVTNDRDCDDDDDEVFAGNDETCDGKDNDCDDEVDESVAGLWWPDVDKDGFGDKDGTPSPSCSTVGGSADNDLDCDDADKDINPDATEVCNGEDDDCDTQTDEGLMVDWAPDVDKDGFGDEDNVTVACSAPSSQHVQDATDCDDSKAKVYPNADTARCDGVDTDCDGNPDDFDVPGDYATIAAGVAGAPDGTTLCLGAGTFSENVDIRRELNVIGKGSGTTILQGDGSTKVFRYEADGTLAGFTVQGGDSTSGAGLYVLGDATLDDIESRDNTCTNQCTGVGMSLNGIITATDLSVHGNSATCSNIGFYRPGAVGITTSRDVAIYGLEVYQNSATATASGDWTVALDSVTGALELHDAIIYDNTFVGPGPGEIVTFGGNEARVERLQVLDNTIDCTESARGLVLSAAYGTGLIENAVIAGNVLDGNTSGSEDNGALINFYTDFEIRNSVIADNTVNARLDGAIIGAFAVTSFDVLTLRNVSITDNVSASDLPAFRMFPNDIEVYYSNLYGQSSGWDQNDPTGLNGNISVAPQYIDPASDDYDLLGTSPLIDSGDPAILDVDGSRSDIGVGGGPAAP